jgi:predicted dehydrogenase
MKEEKVVVGFMGAGGIARAHALSINSLRYYYNNTPEIILEAVCSATGKSRESFGKRFGFSKSASVEEFVSNKKIDSVYILGPNNVHFEHLKAAIEMPSVKRIYIEKPVCSTSEEVKQIARLARDYPKIKIQSGYQYLFMSSVREALHFWKTGKLGKPIHFEYKYYHGDYLHKEYRNKRATRLTPAPDGGAMADLGSHAISLLIAFMGDMMQITSSMQAGLYDDVNVSSDLFSLINLHDPLTLSTGTLSASRISSGTGDMLSMEIFAEKGALRLSSQSADYFEHFLEETGTWNRVLTGSNYKPVSSFPSGHVLPGWLRSLIHAQYVFLTGNDPKAFIPDIKHGLAVQRLLRESAEHMKCFRDVYWKK